MTDTSDFQTHFIQLLHRILQADPHPPALEGSVCLGVHLGGQIEWLGAVLGTSLTLHTEVEDLTVKEAPDWCDAYDAVLLIGVGDALAVADGAPPPEAPVRLSAGDRPLLERFAQRYFGGTQHAALRQFLVK